MDTTGEGDNFQQYLTFRVAGEEYAVGILQVKEIIAYRATTKVPMTLDYFPGVINLRGSVVPVVDLAAKFGFPQLAVSNRTCIVIVDVQVDAERTVIGIMVEAVNAVIDLDPADIEAPPSFGAGVCTDYLRGMGKIGDRFVPILDVDQLLSSDTVLASIVPENGEEAEPARDDEEPAVQPSDSADASASPEPT
jgi:purine-binding chemotaxis protein CheW